MSRLLTILLLVLSCVAAARAGTTSQPASTQVDLDWPAFHRGGPLLGVGPAIATSQAELAVRWTFRAGKNGVENSVAIVGDWVYVADISSGVYCVSLAKGEQRWRFAAPDKDKAPFAASPLVAGGRVFAADTSGKVYALSADSGKKLWDYDSGDAINSSPNLTADGDVVFANDAGKVCCLSPEGKELWAAAIERTNGAIAVSGRVGWAASCDRNLRSIDLASGVVLATIELDSETGASPAVTERGVVIGTNTGKVWCVDPQTEKPRWKFEKIEEGTFVYSTAACSGGVVVLGARDNNVYGLSAADGAQKWKFATEGEVDSSPAISGDRVYVGSKDGKLYVLELGTGKLLWKFDTGKEITSSPAVARGVVIFGDSAGTVYCLEPKR